MRTNLIALDAIEVLESAPDFENAIVTATELLVSCGHVTRDYVLAVMQNLRERGPYFVVAPQVAIAHAKPGPEVRSPGLTLLKLNEGVPSGNSIHQSVKLIFALATPDPDAHIELMGDLAVKLSNPEIMNSLLNASAKSVIWEILNA